MVLDKQRVQGFEDNIDTAQDAPIQNQNKN